jgi:hypothetical protein
VFARLFSKLCRSSTLDRVGEDCPLPYYFADLPIVRINLLYALRDIAISQFLGEVQNKNSTLIIEYEHFGLQNIAKLGSDFASVFQFQNLLVIQPASFNINEDGGLKMITNMQHMSYNYPRVMEC